MASSLMIRGGGFSLTAIPGSGKVHRRRKPFREAIRPYLLLMPMLLLAAGFVYYPFVKTFLYSLTTVNARGEVLAWAGFENFNYLFSRR